MAGEQHPFDLPSDTFDEPGVGGAQAQTDTPQGGAGTPTPQEPRFVPEANYLELKSQVERLKPLESLAWVGEAMQNPEVRQRVTSALMGGGAPMVEQPSTPDPNIFTGQVEAIKAKYRPQTEAALAEGNLSKFGELSADMGAEIGALRSANDLRAAAGPLVTMTARNTIENFYSTKRQNSPLFGKLESKLRAFVDQTPPSKLAELAQSGQLITAMEVAYQKIVTDTYEQAYNKASSEGRLDGSRQEPPRYNMGAAGGGMPAPDTPTDDDKDDIEFQKFMESRGVGFTVDAKTGAITGELR
jgi:hypothetical protein